MVVEIKALEVNQTQELMPLLSNKQVVGRKQVYKIKYQPDDIIECYKAQLIAI